MTSTPSGAFSDPYFASSSLILRGTSARRRRRGGTRRAGSRCRPGRRPRCAVVRAVVRGVRVGVGFHRWWSSSHGLRCWWCLAAEPKSQEIGSEWRVISENRISLSIAQVPMWVDVMNRMFEKSKASSAPISDFSSSAGVSPPAHGGAGRSRRGSPSRRRWCRSLRCCGGSWWASLSSVVSEVVRVGGVVCRDRSTGGTSPLPSRAGDGVDHGRDEDQQPLEVELGGRPEPQEHRRVQDLLEEQGTQEGPDERAPATQGLVPPSTTAVTLVKVNACLCDGSPMPNWPIRMIAPKRRRGTSRRTPDTIVRVTGIRCDVPTPRRSRPPGAASPTAASASRTP